MNKSQSIDQLAVALAKAQAAIRPAIKDSENPHFKSRFADLAAVWDVARVPLTNNGLSVIQSPESRADASAGMVLETTLVHTSGQWVSSAIPLLHDNRSMQSLGSAITYARRYALCSIVGIVAEDEDDDGNAASQPQRQQRDRREQPRREAPDTPSNRLLAWLRGQEKKHGHAIAEYALKWGVEVQGYPDQVRQWTEGQCKAAAIEAEKKMTWLRSQPEAHAAPQPEPAKPPKAAPDRSRSVQAPTTGRELFAWLKKENERLGFDLMGEVASWGVAMSYPERFIDWSPDQVNDAVKKASYIKADHAPDTSDLPFRTVAEFRIWLERDGSEFAGNARLFGDEQGWPLNFAWTMPQCVACYRALMEDVEAAPVA